MPAFSSHYIFARELMPFVKEHADFSINCDAVYYGAQGPDIFFFHRVMPWMCGKSLRKFGSTLHRSKPALLLEIMRSYCNKSDNPELAKSYVYGFIMHYALDRRCHPYVYSLQNKMTQENRFMNPHTAHNKIEFAMDSYLLSKRLNVENPQKFNPAEVFNFNSALADETGLLYEYLAPKVSDINAKAKCFSQAVEDTKYIQKLSTDSTGIKRAIITPIEAIIAPVTKNYKFTAMMRPKDLEKAKKYANIEKSEWISPFDNKAYRYSFEELFEQAKLEAEKMILSYQSELPCLQITQNISFLTGVEVK